jgi:hypothetical protein
VTVTAPPTAATVIVVGTAWGRDACADTARGAVRRESNRADEGRDMVDVAKMSIVLL